MSAVGNGFGDRTSTEMLVACGLGSAAEARAAVDELSGRLQPELVIDLRLAVSELVMNSVEHGPSGEGASVRLLLSTSVERVRCRVAGTLHGEPRSVATHATTSRRIECPGVALVRPRPASFRLDRNLRSLRSAMKRTT